MLTTISVLTLVAGSSIAVLPSEAPPTTAAQVALQAGVVAQESDTSTPAAVSGSTVSPRATYLLSNERWHSDPVVWRKGFLSGLRGFEHFYNPIGNPLYFETPLNNTGVRLLYLHHAFSDDCQLQGGQVNVIAAQARVALSERWAFIATKDGYSDLDTGIGINDEGWNDLAAGLKYAFYVDREADLVVTAGARLMLENFGEAKVLQGDNYELSPFISFAKGWDKFHLMGNLTDRIPFDGDDGNNVLQWDLHADYELADGFAPMLEIHGLHYLSDGERLGLNVGGLDYSNFGSTNVEGSTVIWAGVGARFKFNPHVSVGGTYEYPLTNRDADIMGDRITLDMEWTW